MLKERIDEMVESLQREQYDRQRDDEGHGEVIQELQRMLSQERREKEELRTEVRKLRVFLCLSTQRGDWRYMHVHVILVACTRICARRDAACTCTFTE